MSSDYHEKAQPLRELQWLSQYFKVHSREDLAKEIFEQVKSLRHLAQDSLGHEQATNVIDLNPPTEQYSEGPE